MDTLCMQSIKIVKPDHTSKINHNLEDHLATAEIIDVFETRFKKTHQKTSFLATKWPQDKIEMSETLLRIYRTLQKIFKEMISLLLKM